MTKDERIALGRFTTDVVKPKKIDKRGLSKELQEHRQEYKLGNVNHISYQANVFKYFDLLNRMAEARKVNDDTYYDFLIGELKAQSEKNKIDDDALESRRASVMLNKIKI